MTSAFVQWRDARRLDAVVAGGQSRPAPGTAPYNDSMSPARKKGGGTGGAERRRHDRAGVQIPILYHVEDGVEERVSATLNVSLSGLQFPTRKKLRAKDRLRMRLLLPGEIRPLVLHGTVRWTKSSSEHRGQYHVGVAFERGEASERKALERVLS